MKSSKKHIIIGTLLCMMTMVIFLLFYGKLPESIPVHFDSAGNPNSFWPRNAVVIGVPVVCVLLNFIAGFSITKRQDKKIYMFYIVPILAFVVVGVMVYLGMK
jgi:uncharacterized membrane protein